MVAVAVGEDLVLDLIEPKLIKYLGFSDDDSPPKTVYDLLPPSMAPHHRLWVASAIRSQRLPTRLNHPLRNVEVRHASGFYVPMDLNIEWAQETNKLPTFHLVFAPCSQQQQIENVANAKDVRVGEQVEHTEAVVMLLDIVEFTKACSELSAVEVSTH
jgi:acetylglutamate synthase